MKTLVHKSDTRGHANHGWLNSHHSFSFANYFNPKRMNFGMLRVLNDDVVAPKMGFGTHPHENMEIVSIPLKGDLKHRDNTGTEAVIKSGDIQVMSAGSGIAHSEMNNNADQEVHFLQIWIIPNQKNVTPRYDQISIDSEKTENCFYQILSPNSDDEGVWVHQDAWMHLGEFTQDKTETYQFKHKNNGLYIFVLEGNIEVDKNELQKRDAIGVWDTDFIDIKVQRGSKVLLIEVPMS
ncbi:pirin family protein [Psychroflexus aestuariivivens]|uniref:pirin family protein n=1 Tax=Psychroflexus aestuariivivens TaxID=1795040 RepID=UPI000FD82DB3|nr:pirin family protein [Psychroflexus aestuariivivens]